MADKKDEKKEENPLKSAFSVVMFIIFIIWWSIGWIAVLSSLVCLGFSGSITDKTVGFILAWTLMGPLFFIYLYFNKNYCRRTINK